MMLRFALPFVAFAATAALAQTSLPPIAAPLAPAAPKPATTRVTFQTGAGPITVELETERAPITSANFLRYVDQKRLDGASFYRAVKIQEGYGLLQGGLRNDPKKILKPIAHEPTSKTGLGHVDGVIAMARNAPGSATMDFFIVEGGFPSMDADPKAAGDNQGFAVFGHVTEGMDVVKTLLASPVSATAGPPELRGTMLVQPVKILTVRRSPPASAAAAAK